MKTLVLISDSTGDVGERILRALVSQFPDNTFVLRIYRFVAGNRELHDVFKEVEALTPIVFHTTLLKSFKKQINEWAEARRFPVHDLTGEAMAFLEHASGQKSVVDPERLHELNDEYDRRISALNYTVEHDDAMGSEQWRDADIVLCGVSRTSKTPTSIYLANKGYKVANVPIVKGLPIQERLLQLPRLPIVGLTIDPNRLHDIRMRRSNEEKIPSSDYADLDEIKEELRKAQKLFLTVKCPVIDVTHHAIEEVAALIQKRMPLLRG